MKHGVQKTLIIIGGVVLSLVVVVGLIFGGTALYSDLQDHQLTSQVTQTLKQAKPAELKKLSANHETERYLATHVSRKLTLNSDDQGWKQYEYYAAKLNQQNVEIDVTAVNDSIWHPQYRLTKVKLDH